MTMHQLIYIKFRVDYYLGKPNSTTSQMHIGRIVKRQRSKLR